ncbi:DNA-binding transcriptional ArsR family regulator [Agromyces sp. 3263]|uniref:GbsR/MarR family transcriptional regulator n=1 Tax=Agromyces sp. 3263 TaxID=2817750 RepID=UPI002856F52F|nr:helix-turn-helix domain-containing protein [Agromyces sp. 3263]MDR6905440.1 DNA-binding transcriptional ArsR family regulator [Agromyces sp. 3263]
MPRDEQGLKAAVDQSAAVLTAAGFPRMPARVLMALVVADRGGLTASELGEQLGVSAAAISGAVRYLEQIGILHRLPQPGSRRDKWEFLDDAWYTALMAKSPIYGVIADLGDRAADAIGDETAAGAVRAREMARFYRFVDTRMPDLMREWETLRGEPAAESG